MGEFTLGSRGSRYLSLLALGVAIGIGFSTFRSNGLFWFSDEVTLRPDLVSGAAAVLMVLALYVRRIIEWAPSLYSVLSFGLNVTITAVFVEAILGGDGWSMSRLAMPYLVLFAVILTWAGLRAVAPVVWALVVVLGFVNLQDVSEAMGLWGYLMILLAALGILLQIGPGFGRVVPDLLHDFSGGTGVRPVVEARAAAPVLDAP